MKKFFDLNTEKKLAFYIGVSEKCITLEENEYKYEVIKNALDYCWEWLINQKYDGEFFYELLDNEENGITVISEMIDNEIENAIFNCVIDTIAFTSRVAFDKNNAKYYPEPIALVDDELVYHLLKCFNICFYKNDFVDDLLDCLMYVGNNNYLEWKNEIQNMIK